MCKRATMNHLLSLLLLLTLSFNINAQYTEEWARNMGRYNPNTYAFAEIISYLPNGATVVYAYFGNSEYMIEIYDVEGATIYLSPILYHHIHGQDASFKYLESSNTLIYYDNFFNIIYSIDLATGNQTSIQNTNIITQTRAYELETFFYNQHIIPIHSVWGIDTGYQITKIDISGNIQWQTVIKEDLDIDPSFIKLSDNTILLNAFHYGYDTINTYRIDTNGQYQLIASTLGDYDAVYKVDNEENLYYLYPFDSLINGDFISFYSLKRYQGINTSVIEWEVAIEGNEIIPELIYSDSSNHTYLIGKVEIDSTGTDLLGIHFTHVSPSGMVIESKNYLPIADTYNDIIDAYTTSTEDFAIAYHTTNPNSAYNSLSYSIAQISKTGLWTYGPSELLDSNYSYSFWSNLDSVDNIYISTNTTHHNGFHSFNFTKKYCANNCGPTVTGTVFNDINNNCQNNSEPPLANRVVECLPSRVYNVTNSAGEFAFSKPIGTYSLQQILPRHWNASCNEPVAVSVISSTQPTFTSLGSYITPNVTDGAIYLSSSTAIWGNIHNNTLTYRNVGSNVISGTITLQLDTNLQIVSTSLAPTQQTGNNLTWNISNFQPSENLSIEIVTQPAITLLPIDIYRIENAAQFNIASDAYLPDNAATDHNYIFDWGTPKTDLDSSFANAFIDVQPNGFTTDGKIGINDSVLEYTIRVWNETGETITDGKVQVSIDTNLYLPSLSILSSSHPVEISSIDGNNLIFHFENMQLTSNAEPTVGSVAVIKYQIKTKSSRSLGTQIAASALVLLDYEALYLTNVVTSTIDSSTAAKETKASGNSIILYPNPSNNEIIVKFDHSNTAAITINDVTGKVVLSIDNYENNQRINIAALANGLYFVKVKIDGETSALKFLKQ